MSSEPINKAILLAAGLGTRLRPLTLTTPKPLLPLDGMLLIDHQLKFLALGGIKEVVINLHHLGEKIKEHVGNGIQFNLKIHYSEESQILGTGGGIKKACEQYQGHTFLALNADALIDADLKSLIAHHQKSGAAATMVLKELGKGDKHNPVNIDKLGAVTNFGSGKYFYTGLQILGTETLDILPPAGTASCLIEDGYKKLILSGKNISSFIHRGYFNDIGTPEKYKEAKEDVRSGKFKLCLDPCFRRDDNLRSN